MTRSTHRPDATAEPAVAPPRAPYVAPTLESLGSWSALTMQTIPGGGFIENPIVSSILRGVR